jgi:signal transduction histidine kinase
MARPLLRSSTFRLTLLYISLFSTSVLILFVFFYWSTLGLMIEQADEALDLEIKGLEERYEDDGLNGLTQLMRERIREQPPSGSTIYLLTDFAYTRIVGNLNRWPLGSESAEGFIDFELEDTRFDPAPVIPARGRAFSLRGGYRLLVARGTQDLRIFRKRIVWTLGWGLGIMVLLSLIGSILMNRGMLRRIDSITATSESIMSGNLSQRIPTRGTGDDFDRLAEQLNRMLDQIETLLESVRRISDNIAHDLKTPLTRLRNRLEKLHDRNSGNSEDLELATHEADDLLSTFNALLRIARIETDDRTEGFTVVNLTDLLADVVELYEPLAEEKLQAIILKASDNVCVNGDQHLLFQAIANLLDNAVKYTPENGVIEATLTIMNDNAIITVEDTGPGIPEASHRKVLQRFYRMDSSRNEAGNGLGLSMVSAVCKLHGSELKLFDKKPGLGIRFSLPILKSEDVTQPVLLPAPDSGTIRSTKPSTA